MQKVLTIAGFDPSNGAGLTADVKTFEAHEVYGLSVCTAITIQHESAFLGVEWVDPSIILRQLDVLFSKYDIAVAKIGLVQNLDVLESIIDKLNEKNPSLKIIWDPILKASAGFVFHDKWNKKRLLNLAAKCYLMTPNLEEWEQLFGNANPNEISVLKNVLLKGGHARGEFSTDTLYIGTETTTFKAKRSKLDKHGTGCVLSAAIAANLTKGKDLQNACKQAKQYITTFIQSNDGLLGWHTAVVGQQCIAAPQQQYASLHVLTQDHSSLSHQQMAEAACKGGAKWIQLRIKDESRDIKAIALAVQKICQKYHASLIINDKVNLAKEIQADGVHLGKSDMPPSKARKLLGEHAIIGGTANTMDDIRNLAKAKVNYIGVGPFRFTRTKKQLSPVLGLAGYRKIVTACQAENINIPIIAIGGIQLEDVAEIMETGVQGIAIASAINLAKNAANTCKMFLNELSIEAPIES